MNRVLEKYPHRKGQVIIQRMEKNSGQAAVREWGMLNATGEYIIHCDSDDLVDVTMYEKMYNKAIEEGSDVVVCDYYRSDGVTHKESTGFISKEKEQFVKEMLYMRTSWAVWNKLV